MSTNPWLIPALIQTEPFEDPAYEAICSPAVIATHGRQGIGVVQPQSGTDFPLVGTPSADVRYLFADMYLSYDDPADYDSRLTPFKLPFHIKWVGGAGCDIVALPDGFPLITHGLDVLIADDDGRTVFDSTQSAGFLSQPWGNRLHVLGWETGEGALQIVIHTAWFSEDGSPAPATYGTNIMPTSAQIDERAIERRPKRVKSLTVILDNFKSVGVDWLEGFNVNITHLGQVIRDRRIIQQIGFDATPGNGLGLFPVCDEIPPRLHQINGVSPGEGGNFLLSALDCYAIRQPTTLTSNFPRKTVPDTARLQITNDCTPCCECDDYKDVAEYMNRQGAVYKQIGRDAASVRDQYHANRDRWNAAKCCFEQRPLRLIMQPQVCPYIDVAGQFCNQTDQCIEQLTMHFDFRELTISDDVSLPSGSSATVSASLGLGDPPYEVEEVPGFTFIRGAERAPGRRSGGLTRYNLSGAFPQLTAYWDAVEPFQQVFVRFRLRIIPAAGGGGESFSSDCPVEALPIKVALTATGSRGIVTVPNCGSIPSEPVCAEPSRFPTIARVERTVVLNCPADESFFWDPYACPTEDC